MAAEERFDIYDADMNPIGTAPRSEVHAKGYWHQTFHCWLVRRAPDGLLIRFQKRHAEKDTYPGCYDVTAAGHLGVGETVRDAVREIEEELGIAVSFDELAALGSHREEAAGEAGGVAFVDRELSHTYGLLRDMPLQAFRLQPDEVSGIYEAPADALIALFEGRLASVAAEGAVPDAAGGMRRDTPEVRARDFVERDPGYYAGVFRQLRRLYG